MEDDLLKILLDAMLQELYIQGDTNVVKMLNTQHLEDPKIHKKGTGNDFSSHFVAEQRAKERESFLPLFHFTPHCERFVCIF